MKKFVEYIKQAFTYMVNKSKVWPEIYSLPLALLVWLISPYAIWMLDPTAATFDTGILQIIVYVVVAITAFNGIVFLGIKLNFPVVYEFYKRTAGASFDKLTDFQKICILLFLYISLLLCCVCLAHIMVSPTQTAI